MSEEIQQKKSKASPTAEPTGILEKHLITEIDLRIAPAPATIQPDALEHAVLDGWQEYRLCCSARGELPSSPNYPVPPFDHYRVYRNCNGLIEHNSELNLNNHHLAIAFFQQGKPVRLFLGFDEDSSVLPTVISNLKKLRPHTAVPITTSETHDLRQKPITNPKFNQNLPEDQIYPCVNLPQLRSYLKQLSTQIAPATYKPKLDYLSALHLICHLDLPGYTRPGYRVEITYRGGFFSPEARTIFPLL